MAEATLNPLATVVAGVAGFHVTAEGGRPAAFDRKHDATLFGEKRCAVTGAIVGSEPVEYVGHLEGRPAHDSSGSSVPMVDRMRSSGLGVDAMRWPETWV